MRVAEVERFWGEFPEEAQAVLWFQNSEGAALFWNGKYRVVWEFGGDTCEVEGCRGDPLLDAFVSAYRAARKQEAKG